MCCIGFLGCSFLFFDLALATAGFVVVAAALLEACAVVFG